MAFSDIELDYIDKIVGRLCRRRSPAHLSHKIRVEYEIKNHDVIVFEERPRFNAQGEWLRMDCAKFKYNRTSQTWKLYWMRRDRKWHAYETESRRAGLESLIREVDADPYGAFFG